MLRAALVLIVFAVAVLFGSATCLSVDAAGADLRAQAPMSARTGVLSPAEEMGRTRARLVAKVRRGLVLAEGRWWRDGWFTEADRGRTHARIWETVHLFEAAEGLAAATGAGPDRTIARRYALGGEGYWNQALARGLGGFSTLYETRGDVPRNWFDDNGWLGLAFLDAYRVTGDKRFLTDAQRALRYVYRAGWDPVAGGIWWNTDKRFKATESIATASLLAVRLGEETADPWYVGVARRLIDWANGNVYDADLGLYTRIPGSSVPISYLQSPMLAAMARLCRDRSLYCERVPPLIDATLARYGQPLDHAPQYDAMYIRFLVDAFDVTGDQRLYRAADEIATAAEDAAEDEEGYFTRDWRGGSKEVNQLQAHGATLEALSWFAAARPPK